MIDRARILVRTEFTHPDDRIGVTLLAYDTDARQRFEAKPIEWEERRITEPLSTHFTISLDDAQELMDLLWKIGIRPTEGAGTAGSMAATQKHLDDLRTIAFHSLKIKGEGI